MVDHTMSVRSFFRKLAGRAGKASRGKRGASSHVNKASNKRAANKYIRRRTECMRELDTFAYDYHLDIPDEIKGDR